VSFPDFNFFGNPRLKPEESVGYDGGFEQPVLNDRLRFGATWFRNEIANLIATNATFTSYTNIGKAAEGSGLHRRQPRGELQGVGSAHGVRPGRQSARQALREPDRLRAPGARGLWRDAGVELVSVEVVRGERDGVPFLLPWRPLKTSEGEAT